LVSNLLAASLATIGLRHGVVAGFGLAGLVQVEVLADDDILRGLVLKIGGRCRRRWRKRVWSGEKIKLDSVGSIFGGASHRA
jgi:hypothetical protein